MSESLVRRAGDGYYYNTNVSTDKYRFNQKERNAFKVAKFFVIFMIISFVGAVSALVWAIAKSIASGPIMLDGATLKTFGPVSLMLGSFGLAVVSCTGGAISSGIALRSARKRLTTQIASFASDIGITPEKIELREGKMQWRLSGPEVRGERWRPRKPTPWMGHN